MQARVGRGEVLSSCLWSLCGESLKNPGMETRRCESLSLLFSPLPHSEKRTVKSKGRDAAT